MLCHGTCFASRNFERHPNRPTALITSGTRKHRLPSGFQVSIKLGSLKLQVCMFLRPDRNRCWQTQ